MGILAGINAMTGVPFFTIFFYFFSFSPILFVLSPELRELLALYKNDLLKQWDLLTVDKKISSLRKTFTSLKISDVICETPLFAVHKVFDRCDAEQILKELSREFLERNRAHRSVVEALIEKNHEKLISLAVGGNASESPILIVKEMASYLPEPLPPVVEEVPSVAHAKFLNDPVTWVTQNKLQTAAVVALVLASAYLGYHYGLFAFGFSKGGGGGGSCPPFDPSAYVDDAQVLDGTGSSSPDTPEQQEVFPKQATSTAAKPKVPASLAALLDPEDVDTLELWAWITDRYHDLNEVD